MGKPTCHVSTLQCYKRLLLCKGQGLFVWMPCIYMTWLGGSPVSGKGALLSALQGLQQVLHDKLQPGALAQHTAQATVCGSQGA